MPFIQVKVIEDASPTSRSREIVREPHRRDGAHRGREHAPGRRGAWSRRSAAAAGGSPATHSPRPTCWVAGGRRRRLSPAGVPHRGDALGRAGGGRVAVMASLGFGPDRHWTPARGDGGAGGVRAVAAETGRPAGARGAGPGSLVARQGRDLRGGLGGGVPAAPGAGATRSARPARPPAWRGTRCSSGTASPWRAGLVGARRGAARGLEESVEHGWHAVREAELAVEVDHDPVRALDGPRGARRLIGQRLGHGDLEVVGEALQGLALTSLGDGRDRDGAAGRVGGGGHVGRRGGPDVDGQGLLLADRGLLPAPRPSAGGGLVPAGGGDLRRARPGAAVQRLPGAARVGGGGAGVRGRRPRRS